MPHAEISGARHRPKGNRLDFNRGSLPAARYNLSVNSIGKRRRTEERITNIGLIG
jgi:hypothetical protein